MLHGCVASWYPHVQTVRNYVPEEVLKRHLAARRAPYQKLPDAKLSGAELSDAMDGDVLTVDDSTSGAARACILAREAGHDVTLFVNPAQIARRRPYWFSRLDAIMDQRQVTTAAFEGREFDVRPGRPLRTFRLAVKARLMTLAEADADGILDELAAQLGARTAAVPEHARTMTVEELRQLVARGVQIGSHGWDHRDIAAMSEAEIIDDLRCAREWFHDNLGLHPAHYAVPYGLSPLTGRAAREVPGRILLANVGLGVGFLGDRQWNRRDITSELQGRHA
jgi:hypothetical protein